MYRTLLGMTSFAKVQISILTVNGQAATTDDFSKPCLKQAT
ncbi:MAG: hypothetical protein CM15mP120_03180 [Pseudomonadota bacterium]|nr:MAG: hypothetical protein CM15mP120_03180 [Pseudomonadota bacterium]